ncbi:hypothetical protein [Streptomyces diastaticus]|uniref:hypothetical protein n=1 Tax=Streptomyces diastaticus TaxID=1956 RepID=UPI0035E19B7C
MSTPPQEEETDVLIGRCYTHARRFPLVMGRLPGGGRLWGGPYTIPQAIVIVSSAVLLITTQEMWAHFGVVGNAANAIGMPFTLGLFVRRMRIDGRHPFAVLGSLLGLIGAPQPAGSAAAPCGPYAQAGPSPDSAPSRGSPRRPPRPPTRTPRLPRPRPRRC